MHKYKNVKLHTGTSDVKQLGLLEFHDPACASMGGATITGHTQCKSGGIRCWAV